MAVTGAMVAVGCAAMFGAGTAEPARAATIVVNSARDELSARDGAVSLREAIAAIDAGDDLGDPDLAAATAGAFGVADEIVFAIPPGAGTPSIRPSAPLPAITTPLTIDARTETGAAAAPVGGVAPPLIGVALDGQAAGPLTNGIVAQAPLTVTGLALRHFGASGVLLGAGSAGSAIAGNVIAFNGGAGVTAISAADTISENSIARNGGAGIAPAGPAPTASVSLRADHRTVRVRVSGATPLQPITAEIFANPAQPRCPGEGAALAGIAAGVADAAGAGTISLRLPAILPSRDGLTVTVTDPVQGTSPFACLPGGVPSRPGLSSVALTPSVFAARHGTELSLTLTEAARLSVRITRTIRGHRVDHACVARAAGGRRCTRTSLDADLSFSGSAGRNRIPLRVTNLSPGRYTAVVFARDARNLRSPAVALALRIRR